MISMLYVVWINVLLFKKLVFELIIVNFVLFCFHSFVSALKPSERKGGEENKKGKRKKEKKGNRKRKKVFNKMDPTNRSAAIVLLLAIVGFQTLEFKLDLKEGILECFLMGFQTFVASNPARSQGEINRNEWIVGGYKYLPPMLFGVNVEEIYVPRSGDIGQVPVLLARPKKSFKDPIPLIISFHPGGFVYGSHHDPIAYTLARELNVIVASVGYRKGPKFKYPAGHNDAWDVLMWMGQNGAEKFGIDTNKIFVSGASAGGNLAAATALKDRDLGTNLVKGQILLVPMLLYGANTKSYAEFGHYRSLSAQTMVWFWTLLANRQDCDSYCQPGSVASRDLRNLPPTLVVLASLDALHDEGEHYAQNLEKAKNQVELFEVYGTHVGSLFFQSDKVIAKVKEFAKEFKWIE